MVSISTAYINLNIILSINRGKISKNFLLSKFYIDGEIIFKTLYISIHIFDIDFTKDR